MSLLHSEREHLFAYSMISLVKMGRSQDGTHLPHPLFSLAHESFLRDTHIKLQYDAFFCHRLSKQKKT